MKLILNFLAVLLCLFVPQQIVAQRTLYFDDVDENRYPDNMSFTCVVEENGSRILDCEVAAFDQDGVLRGSYYSDPTGVVFLMVQGEANEGVIHFKVVTGSGTDEDPYVIRDINETYNFFLNDIKGEYFDPYVFTVGELISASPITETNTAGFATYSCAEDVKIKTEGIKAYKAVISNECIVLTELNGYIPAGTGVLLYGEGVTDPIAFENPANNEQAADNLSDNCLQPTTTAGVAVVDKSTVSGTIWALSAENSFLKFTGSAFIANRAFLVYELAGNASEMRIVFSEEGSATGLETKTGDKDSRAYDLLGRKAGKEGFQIKDGKIIRVSNGK